MNWPQPIIRYNGHSLSKSNPHKLHSLYVMIANGIRPNRQYQLHRTQKNKQRNLTYSLQVYIIASKIEQLGYRCHWCITLPSVRETIYYRSDQPAPMHISYMGDLMAESQRRRYLPYTCCQSISISIYISPYERGSCK